MPVKKRSWLDISLLDNPVLVQAIGLTPVIVAATTLYSALWIAALGTLHIFLCEGMASLMKKVPEWLRIGVYFALGLAIACPMTFVLERWGEAYSGPALRVFLPLMALNTISAARCERFAISHGFWENMRDAAANAAGFATVTILAGAIRELLGYGTLLDFPVSRHLHIRGFWMPFGGFLLLGAMAAVLKTMLLRMADRGVYTGAEVTMELAPDDRQARLEKSRRLVEEMREIIAAHDSAVPHIASPDEVFAEPEEDTPQEEPKQVLTREEKMRLRKTIDELLEEFHG